MNRRQAILKTADLFETNPEMYKFWSCSTPDCGTPGCALGYVAHFSGCKSGQSINPIAHKTVGVVAHTFYFRMSAFRLSHRGISWHDDAAVCSKALRLYADKYHPETESYPNILKEITRISRERVTA